MKPRARFARAAPPCTMFLLHLWTSSTGKRSSNCTPSLEHWACATLDQSSPANRSLQNTCVRKTLITCKLGSLRSTTRYIGNTAISGRFLEDYRVSAGIELHKFKWVLNGNAVIECHDFIYSLVIDRSAVLAFITYKIRRMGSLVSSHR